MDCRNCYHEILNQRPPKNHQNFILFAPAYP